MTLEDGTDKICPFMRPEIISVGQIAQMDGHAICQKEDCALWVKNYRNISYTPTGYERCYYYTGCSLSRIVGGAAQ
jgi:hypothetical protein